MKSIQTLLYWCAAISVASLPYPAKGEVTFLDQSWDDVTRQLYYTTTQGSRMLPYEWFVALEVSDGEASFLKTRVPQLGYLPNEDAFNNRDQLPVGFVVDVDAFDQKHVGLNCAACHTNRIQYQGKVFQIDGAPTLADMWGLLTGIGDSLNATATNEPKFGRFASAVLGPAAPANQVADLRNSLNSFRSHWNQFIADSTPDPTNAKFTWGRGRLDAFGMIFNRVSSIDLEIPGNSHHPNAPVSYPFLWGASAEDRVQWNASAPNRNDIERLGRNIGEVLGVFAQADLQKASLLRPYYRTSARRLNMVHMENWLKSLSSPQWPDEFPPIDQDKKIQGEKLFVEHCAHCHQVVPHGEQETPVTVVRIPVGDVGTDGRMAQNSIMFQASTGRLEGSVVPPGFDLLPANMPTGALLVNVVRGAEISPFRDIETTLLTILPFRSKLLARGSAPGELTPDDIQRFLQDTQFKTQQELVQALESYREFINDYNRRLVAFADKAGKLHGSSKVQMDDNPYVYKARPLDGIWATAPYLHNGSVPNLYELLLPAGQRTKKFYVGNMEYDPVNVGFQFKSGPGTTEIDTSLDGNRNTGHDQYGAGLNHDQRMQLLEYLKSL